MLARIFLLYTTSASIWKDVQETYSKMDNTSEFFSLESQAFSLKQEGMTVTLYYHTLNSIWQQLDLHETIEWVNLDDAKIYQTLSPIGEFSSFFMAFILSFVMRVTELLALLPFHPRSIFHYKERREQPNAYD
ncbi:hypothetical protein GQ457_02G042850 [Hibiscus cannabinus]